MTRSNAIVTGAALICLTLGAAGCSTAFADFHDGAPESKTTRLPAGVKAMTASARADSSASSGSSRRRTSSSVAPLAASAAAMRSSSALPSSWGSS